jgi:hypothetical protein
MPHEGERCHVGDDHVSVQVDSANSSAILVINRSRVRSNFVSAFVSSDPSVQLRRNFQELMTDCGLDIPSYSLRAAGRVPNAAVEAQLKELQHRAKVNVTMIFDARSRLVSPQVIYHQTLPAMTVNSQALTLG